jgi:NADH dehydrogenase [ubiquinone] 1 alpha subcomplex assembly factor 7
MIGSLCRGFSYASRCVSSRSISSSTFHHASDLTSGLILPSTGPLEQPKAKASLEEHIRMKIMMRGGPISLAEYMADCLTSPHGGYYMNRDVFGTKGDFTTSPEISQLFGEMVGIWCLSTWMSMGSPKRLRLVEMGPGRGTLMADLLRGVSAFPQFTAAIEVHLVEVSPMLRKIQFERLDCSTSPSSGGLIQDGQVRSTLTSCSGQEGCPVYWHNTIDEVPSGSALVEGGQVAPALYIAHEFFDALPAHQFVLDKERGWLEVMVDAQEGKDAGGSGGGLRKVLSPSRTPASALLVPRRLKALTSPEAISALEISAKQMLTAETLAKRVSREGGAAIVIDYGSEKGSPPYKDSLVALRDHKEVDILDQPGSADLSVWVDFGALQQAAEEGDKGVQCHGPVSQRVFLESLGIHTRLEQLIRRASGPDSEEARGLRAGVARLIGSGADGGMGDSYKVFSITGQDSTLWKELGLSKG